MTTDRPTTRSVGTRSRRDDLLDDLRATVPVPALPQRAQAPTASLSACSLPAATTMSTTPMTSATFTPVAPWTPHGDAATYSPRGWGSRSSNTASRFSALAVKASVMSSGWNIPDCQVAICSSESSTEWSRA